MHKTLFIAATSLLWASAVAAVQPNPVQVARVALGSDGLNALRITVVGATSTLAGNELDISDSGPAVPTVEKSYQVVIDYASNGMRVDSALTNSSTTGYFIDDQRAIEYLSGNFAWNEPLTNATKVPDASKRNAQAHPDEILSRLLWLWTIAPQGVLKAATNATVHGVPGGTELTFILAGQHMSAFINLANQVERVETKLPSSLFGDVPVVVKYSGYKDFGGIQFPSRIARSLGGYPALNLTVTAVERNPVVDFTVPENVRTYDVCHYFLPMPNCPLVVKSQRVTDGVYWISGLMHHSMAVDMGDYAAVVEAPLNEARSEAVIAETEKLIPGKPVRYVINTRIHSDHSMSDKTNGGLRTYVDEGAVVVTPEANRAFYEKVWAAPRMLQPDRLSKSGKHATFLTVKDQAKITGTNGRTIDLYMLRGNLHNKENLVVWLPTERILYQLDVLEELSKLTGPVTTPQIDNFYYNLQRLKIEPLQIVGGHGPRVLTMADLNTATGRVGTN